MAKFSIQYFVLGYMQNNDVPMHIANCCGGYYFTGCLDEVRINAFKKYCADTYIELQNYRK